MNIKEVIACSDFPCQDIKRNCYLIPDVQLEPIHIKMIMITEAPPPDANGYFYAHGTPFYLQTTIQAFRDAGIAVASMKDILDRGVYITTAIKCGKIGYGITAKTIDNCSKILEQEIRLFPQARVYLLMGDVAINALNDIARRNIGKRAIPAGATYKIRKNQFFYGSIRLFPSYVPTGQNYLIEKSKRQMIADDLRTAFELIKKNKE